MDVTDREGKYPVIDVMEKSVMRIHAVATSAGKLCQRRNAQQQYKRRMLACALLILLAGPEPGRTRDQMSAGDALTVSTEESGPAASWLDLILSGQLPIAPVDGDNGPGYFAFEVQTFCLAAGKHGPAAGDRYRMGTIQGTRASILDHILARHAEHPEIAQGDVQRLIWAVQTMTPYSQLPAPLREASRNLLDPTEIVALEAGAPTSISVEGVAGSLLGFLGSAVKVPEPVSEAVTYLRKMRAVLTDPAASYEQIAAVAVPDADRAVVNATGSDASDAGESSWSYAGEGIYQRLLPERYWKSRMELVYAQPWEARLDSFGWPVGFASDTTMLKVRYAGEPNGNIRRLASVTLTGASRQETLRLDSTGFVLDSSALLNGQSPPCDDAQIGAEDCAQRAQWSRNLYARMSEYRKAKRLSTSDDGLLPLVRALDFARAMQVLLEQSHAPAWTQEMQRALVSEEAAVGCRMVADCNARTAPFDIGADDHMGAQAIKVCCSPGHVHNGWGTFSVQFMPEGSSGEPARRALQPLAVGGRNGGGSAPTPSSGTGGSGGVLFRSGKGTKNLDL